MKIKSLRPVLAVFFIIHFSFSVFAQRSKGLAVAGKVSVQQGVIESAYIQMFIDGRRMDNYGIGADGNYKVELTYNHKYELIFTAKGNFQQKYVVETTVPKEILQTDPRFPVFPLDINLFTEIPGVDKSFTNNNILKIYYSKNVDNFISERYYNDAQIAKLIEQAVIQSKQVGKESDFLSRLTKAELAEMRKEYNSLIDQAGKEYSKEEFLAALDGYKAAGKIFPNEQFPKDRIAEINDLLGLLMVAAELDKALAERFDKLIKEGDVLLGQKNYADARNSYNRALSIKPNDAYANQKIQFINDILKKQIADENYNGLIAQADLSFNQLLYSEASAKYKDALQVKPNESYPKTKLKEIEEILANAASDAKKQESYKQAMDQGEIMFQKQFYDKALASYENALSLKPGDEPATRKIDEVKRVMSNIADKINFDQFIKSGDRNYKKSAWKEALADYNNAAQLFPNDNYVNKQITDINNKLAAETNFTQLITNADKEFEAKKYEGAKSLYQEALTIRKEDKHAAARVVEIDGILVALGVDQRYNSVIAEADKLFNEKNYESARGKYTEASTVKPKENYPKTRVAEINTLLQQIAKTEQDYQKAIAKGDGLMQQKQYDQAIATFTEAGKLKPDEKYPPEMIAKANTLIAENKRLAAEAEAERIRLEKEKADLEASRLIAEKAEKDKNYSDAIAKADNFFNEKNYENAHTEYRNALTVKPGETYPQQRVTEIGTLLAQLSAAQKAYETAIAKADKEFKAEKFDAAKLAYLEAQKAKPEEVYPGEQIAKIDSTVETRARLAAEAEAERIRLEKEKADAEAARLAAVQAEKDKNYSDAIAKADNFFNEKNYENARTEYRNALAVKPGETYPQQRVTEIGTLLAQLSAAQKAYETAIAKADKEFKAEKFDAAKLAYNEAKTAIPEEKYPTEQIAKIDSTVETRARLAAEAEAERIRLEKEKADAEAARLAAVQAEKDKNYSDAIAKADNFFNEKNYENARTEYRNALTVKPGETYPQQKVTEIGNLLAQLSAAQKAYETAIAKADKEFKAEKFDVAKLAYQEAQKAKPEEVYPAEQIAKIDSTVETRARLAAEAEAERIRLEKEKAEAEAAKLAAVQAEKDKNYGDAIAKADNFFNEKNYENARTEYRNALAVKPGETYPQQRVTEIGTLLAQLSAAQKAYETAIAKADKEFKVEKFDAAKLAYQEAQKAIPEEKYPAEQIAKIDSTVETRARLAAEAEAERIRLEKEKADAEAARLAAVQAEKDKNYSDAIAKADNLFNEKNYENARTEYRNALTVKPGETYPQQRVTEIGNLLAQLSAAQKAYETAIAKADKEFKAEKFDAAKLAYTEAQKAKPDEVYPGEQIAKIDSTVETRGRLAAEAEAERIRLEKEKADAEAARLAAVQAEKDKNYSDAIAKADNFFNDENYENARTEYRNALTVKPGETYPQQRIDEIGKTLAALDQAKKEQELLDRNYANLIQQADRFFTTKVYNDSKDKYAAALQLKPAESYPKDKIAEIEKILEQQAIDEKYRVIVVAADGFFKTEKYLQAKDEYNKALEVKPSEQYPKSQIAKIEDILNKEQQRILADKQKAEDLQRRTDELAKLNQEIEARGVASDSELNSLYDNYIRQADNYFDTKEYNISRGWYYRALDVKSSEAYPKQRINEINRLIGGLLLSQLDKDYQRYIDLADSTFRDNQLAVSRGWYNRALGVKAAEKYPKDQIAEIEKKIAERMAGQSGQQFENNVKKAAAAFDAGNFNVARFWYKKALELKPGDEEVKKRLSEVEEKMK